MRFGFCGPSYTLQSPALADEECINFFLQTNESQGGVVAKKVYGGATANSILSLIYTPGLVVFSTLPQSPVRGQWLTQGRYFAVGGGTLYEVTAAGVQAVRGAVGNDGNPVSIVDNGLQMLIVSAGRAFCFTLATNALLDVTPQLAGAPAKCEYSDSYGIVFLQNSNEFQFSNPLDFSTWNALEVNEVSVFSENIVSIICNHRELWIFGSKHYQPYQDTGSAEIFDVIPGAMIETGCAATFSTCRADNSVFWVDQTERGAWSCWRSSGYTPVRISTHAVELALTSYANTSQLVSYAYEDSGHLFWVLYIPEAPTSWAYDVAEGLWHKRASWTNGKFGPHFSWNHCYAFGMHLVGDWNSGNIYQLTSSTYQDNGNTIRRVRRAPTILDEMKFMRHSQMVIDIDTGLGPQPPLLDGNNEPRAPQAVLRWSDDRGHTFGNDHVADCGQAGQFRTRAIWRRLGRSRYRVYELVVTDPIPWFITDAYLEMAP